MRDTNPAEQMQCNWNPTAPVTSSVAGYVLQKKTLNRVWQARFRDWQMWKREEAGPVEGDSPVMIPASHCHEFGKGVTGLRCPTLDWNGWTSAISHPVTFYGPSYREDWARWPCSWDPPGGTESCTCLQSTASSPCRWAASLLFEKKL